LKFTIVNFILLKNILDNNLTDIVDIYPFGVGNEIKTLKIKQINLHDNIIFGAVSIIYNLEDKDDSFNIKIVPLDCLQFHLIFFVQPSS
jgi:hypothetical protein